MLLAWSAVLSWMLFAVDLAAMAYLARRAYRDGEFSFLFSPPLAAFPAHCMFLCGKRG